LGLQIAKPAATAAVKPRWRGFRFSAKGFCKLWLALLAQSKQSQKPKQSKAKNPSLFLLV
jgi:hypothetical protein